MKKSKILDILSDRETHDLTHAMLAMPTTILGEVLVKWVEGLQTRLPMCVGGAIFGPLRFRARQRERYCQVLPWAIRSASPQYCI
jgi:ubiquinone biosynthesis protein COQ4